MTYVPDVKGVMTKQWENAREELAGLLHRHGIDSYADVPAHILATSLLQTVDSLEAVTGARDKFLGRGIRAVQD